jgi:hypothetical protein
MAGATNATGSDVTSFLSYAKDFMSYAKNSTSTQSYKAIYDMIVGDVEKFQNIADIGDILSGAGFGQTEKDIRLLIAAFNDMGVSTESLAGYLKTASEKGVIAADATGEFAGDLQNTGTPFANVQAAINAFTGTGLKSVDDTLSALAAKLGISFTPGIGEAAGSAIVAGYAPAAPAKSWTINEGYWYNPVQPQYKSPAYVAGWSYWPPGTTDTRPPGYARGGLSSGPSIFGEKGPEWAVPTYEPERSSFLRDVGADPETIGKAIASQLQGIGGGETMVVVQIDSDVLARSLARIIPRNGDLRASLRRALN